MTYTTPDVVAKQIGKQNLVGPPVDAKLQMCVDAAEFYINDWINAPVSLDPPHPGLSIVALSLAVDLWKQPDATFGIAGAGETGMVRIARDLLNRFDSLLIPYYQDGAWGVA